MKTIVLTAAILISGMTSVNAHEKSKKDLKTQIENTIVYDDIFELMDSENKALERLSLTIDENGTIEVHDTNYSNKLVKDELVEKIKQMEIDESQISEESYMFEFLFEKI
jgi:hypothetical protein